MKSKSLLVYLFVILLIASSAPFYLWNFSFLNLSALAGLLWGLWEVPKDGKRIVALMMLFVFYLYACIHQYTNPNFFGIIFAFLPFFIFLIKDEYWNSIYTNYFFIYSISLIPSLVVYFMVTFWGFDLPHHYIPPLNELKENSYIVYPFLVVEDTITSMRFRGYYDEPGVIGTISGILLVVNKCNLKEWKNWPLLISGIFSFSLFFYLLLSMYVFLFGKTKYKLIVGGLLLLAIVYFVSEDSLISELILSRLTVEDGEWVGDNRTTQMFETYWSRFWASDIKWFGYGRQFADIVADPGGASYKHVIIDLGIIVFGLLVIAISLLYKSILKDYRTFLFVLFIFLCNIYQRPMIYWVIGVFLVMAPAAHISRRSYRKM